MKGHTNNVNGRPKGVPNKITKDLKALINDFLNDEWQTIKEDFKSLPPFQRILYFEKLLSYCIPKNKEIEESEPFAEQPLFFTLKNYAIDEQTIKNFPYEDLKKLILDSELFLQSKQGSDYILTLTEPLDINVPKQF